MAPMLHFILIFFLIQSSRLFTRAEEISCGQNYTIQDDQSLSVTKHIGFVEINLMQVQPSGSSMIHRPLPSGVTNVTFTMGDLWEKFFRTHLRLHGRTPYEVTFDIPDGSVKRYTIFQDNAYFPYASNDVVELRVGINWLSLRQGGRWSSFAADDFAQARHLFFNSPKLLVELSSPPGTSYNFVVPCRNQGGASTEGAPAWYVIGIILPILLVLFCLLWGLYRSAKNGDWLTCCRVPGCKWEPKLHRFLFGGLPEDFAIQNAQEERKGRIEEGDYTYLEDFFDLQGNRRATGPETRSDLEVSAETQARKNDPRPDATVLHVGEGDEKGEGETEKKMEDGKEH